MSTEARMTPEELQTISNLARDGVPPSWISETVGRHHSVVRRRMEKMGIGANADWLSTQLAIRHAPLLRDLHQEFAPRT